MTRKKNTDENETEKHNSIFIRALWSDVRNHCSVNKDHTTIAAATKAATTRNTDRNAKRSGDGVVETGAGRKVVERDVTRKREKAQSHTQ